MYSAQAGDSEAVQMLLEANAAVNAEDEDGLKPLHFAASTGDAELCRLLLRYRAEVQAVDDDGRSALHLVPEFSTETKANRKVWQEGLQLPNDDEFSPEIPSE